MISKVRKADSPENILKAADLLGKGGIIICPTETIYGFAANALIANAVRHIDTIKKRRAGETYIILMKDIEMAKRFNLEFDLTSEKLAKRFWPGPLTMVLPIAKESSLIHLAHMGTLAIRISSDLFLEKLFEKIDFPIISTSVNLSGKPPIESPARMEDLFRREVDMILERGLIRGKLPSTIIAIKNETITMIRKGAIPENKIYGN